MSHQTEIATQFNDIRALALACEDLGLALVENGTQRTYSGTQKAAHVIKCKGPYDIAVEQQEDGKLKLSTDWWAGHVAKEVGFSIEHLTQKYGAEKAAKLGANNLLKLTKQYGIQKSVLEAKKKGYFVTKTVNANGQPRLIVGGIK